MFKYHPIAALFFAAFVFAISGCNVPSQQPIVIIVTATPGAFQSSPPTLTPLPALPTSIRAAQISPTLPPIIPATPTVTPQALQPPPPTQPPPPAQPTATPVLPKLEVFDQGGGQMDLTMFGPKVANKLMAFRAIVCNPDCKNNRPDGKDVDSVKFTFYKWNTSADERGAKVYEHTEGAAPYCSFGGSNTCDFVDVSNKNAKWPGTNIVIDNGEYYFDVRAAGKNGRNWDGNFRFKVQR